MSWTKWLPWRFIVRQAAKRQGFLDPIELLAKLRRFSQPSEVGEPVELLRAGVVFHARGLVNSKVIQHNLDWIWPYWVERQFDPHDDSFIPRAFSISHINLTHRNWTAIGHPDCEELPIVDPRGLLTPFLDGWSLDGWVVSDDGDSLLPSKLTQDKLETQKDQSIACEQHQSLQDGVAVITNSAQQGLQLKTEARVVLQKGKPMCQLTLTAKADKPASLVLSLRPQNPEGVSFIHKVALTGDRKSWLVDENRQVHFSEPAKRNFFSDYHQGDVFLHLHDANEQTEQLCDVGLVSAAALFEMKAGEEKCITASVPLSEEPPVTLVDDAWEQLRRQACKFKCPEPVYQTLYDEAITSLILHSPHDVYPGPYTYKRFWFRDAAFIIHALLCAGLTERAERALSRFPERQTTLGYFRSQEGEWDANGEVLWILQRFEQLTGKKLDNSWQSAIKRGARWIIRKRLSDELDAPHAGLLPAGFSAEHLGPNDYYYWDDFWGIAGLRAADALLRESDSDCADEFAQAADDFEAAVDRSLAKCEQRLGRPAMPASPYRRLDAGAIGSLAVGYPLQQCAPDDARLIDCANFLQDRCFVEGGFFQDMIHSGINAYLTLHTAQVMLRSGDPRYLELMDSVARLASDTGQWPEAIHPHTKGGCMGDGHHVWAAAEWVLMIRNCFVREEGDTLILASGVPERWLSTETPVEFGPAPTSFGELSVTLSRSGEQEVELSWQADWHQKAGVTPPRIEIRLPGYEPMIIDKETSDTARVTLKRSGQA